jgi:hypothetical protein
MKLRAKLEKLGDIDGLTHEEKDPEEFLNTLLQQVFKEDPYLTLRSGTSSQPQESYMYQLFMEKDETMVLPTVQKLLEQSFIGGDLKLTKIPQVFILQMPRFGKQFKLYDRIFPSPKLRINDITEGCMCVGFQCHMYLFVKEPVFMQVNGSAWCVKTLQHMSAKSAHSIKLSIHLYFVLHSVTPVASRYINTTKEGIIDARRLKTMYGSQSCMLEKSLSCLLLFALRQVTMYLL